MFARARGAVEPRDSQVFVHTWPCPSKPAALDESKSRSGPHVPGDDHIGNRTSAVDEGGTRHRCPAASTSQYQNRNNNNDQPGRRRPGPGCPKGCETGCFPRFSCHGQGRSPTPTQPPLPGRKRHQPRQWKAQLGGRECHYGFLTLRGATPKNLGRGRPCRVCSRFEPKKSAKPTLRILCLIGGRVGHAHHGTIDRLNRPIAPSPGSLYPLMTAPTNVLHQPQRHRFGQSLPRLMYGSSLSLASFLPWDSTTRRST